MMEGSRRTVISHSTDETIALGANFARELRGGDLVTIEGELGAGKTHFVKGICRGAGYDGLVSSPTFAIINEYPGPTTIYHIDLYRLETSAQVRALGLEEVRRPDSIVLVEWPAVAGELLSSASWRVECSHGDDETARVISIFHPVETPEQA